jgi:hypothetical protein
VTDSLPVPPEITDEMILAAQNYDLAHRGETISCLWTAVPDKQVARLIAGVMPAIRADERKRWLAAIKCPSPCDDDCELRPDGCHEEHDVPSHWAHNPFQCSEIRLAIAAAVVAERASIVKMMREASTGLNQVGTDDALEIAGTLGDFADMLAGDS